MIWLNPGCSEPRAPVAESVLSVCWCVACVSVWSWSVLQFALQDLKIALANTPNAHPLFVLCCIVYYKSVCVTCVCVCVCLCACLCPLPTWLAQCNKWICGSGVISSLDGSLSEARWNPLPCAQKEAPRETCCQRADAPPPPQKRSRWLCRVLLPAGEVLQAGLQGTAVQGCDRGISVRPDGALPPIGNVAGDLQTPPARSSFLLLLLHNPPTPSAF